MSKSKLCNVCGNNSGKRRTCESCKSKYPYMEGLKAGKPFVRKRLYEKDKLKNGARKRRIETK